MKEEQLNIHIVQLVRNYIVENSFVKTSEFNNSALIFKEGILDSMGFLKLITFIENEFGFQVIDNDLSEENFESINAITEFIIRKTQ